VVADGKALYHLNPAGPMMAAPITAVRDRLELGAPVVLFLTRIVGGGVDLPGRAEYDVALPYQHGAPITLIHHWNPEVKRPSRNPRGCATP
jgi:hypothetical protein